LRNRPRAGCARTAGIMSIGMFGPLYGGLTRLAAPALRIWLRRRLKAGKEDGARIGEREGKTAATRPAGPLLWIHGASVGEINSARPLVAQIAADRPGLSFLVTSGTVTSAEMFAQNPFARAIHQYAPLDAPAWVDRFLDHWRPDAALWLESELWPNLIARARARGVRMALINGRMTARTFTRWRRLAAFARPPLDAFDPCLAMSVGDAERLTALGARAAHVGNIKFDGAPLACDAAALAGLRTAIGARPTWFAASTHPGEEAMLERVQARLRAELPDALLIIAPRHAARGGEIAAQLAASGLSRRSTGALPRGEDAIYLADTMGELGLFYRVAAFAYVGKSMDAATAKGGQNPLEPARLGIAPVFGPHMANFREIADSLLAAGGAIEVRDAEELAGTARDLFADADARRQIAEAAMAVAEHGRGAVARVCAALAPMLDAITHDARA
jgi:3-deoxy-D-manno-octulosonic-acid transferase